MVSRFRIEPSQKLVLTANNIVVVGKDLSSGRIDALWLKTDAEMSNTINVQIGCV